MTERSKTLRSLLALGFEAREDRYGCEAVGYRFHHLDLTATDTISEHFRPIVLLAGTINTGRTLAMIDSEIPPNLTSPASAAAWVSYALHSHRSDLKPLPSWFLEGESHWDLIPQVRRLRDYEARPRCVMKRDHARMLRRDLRKALNELADPVHITISFDGLVLTLRLGDERMEVLADGKPWPSTIVWQVSADTNLPRRFEHEIVAFAYFGGCLEFSNRRYPATETAK